MNKILSIKNVSYTMLILNLTSMILGIVYLATMFNYTVVWDIFGIIYLVTLFGNSLLVYLNSIKLNKQNKIGNRLSLMGYLYLTLTILAMIGMFLGNFLYSVTYAPELGANLISLIIVYLSFFGLLGYGALFAYVNIKNIGREEIWKYTPKETTKGKKIIKICLMLICYSILLVGVYFSVITLFGAELDAIGGTIAMISGSIGMFVAQLDLFFVFINLSATVFLLKLKDRHKSPRSYYGVAIIGLVVSGIFMGPLLLTPYSINAADQSFTTAFGEDWQAKIPENIADEFFLKTPFSTPEYFLGMITDNYRVNSNVLYYDAEGIQLFFDVYTPLIDGSTLPGNNSVLIRIHGGGWTAGDKGLPNMMQMNKYFAAQGYIVFDIQYGLYDAGWEILPTPNYVKGNFSVDDMVRHIGNFTKYVVQHADEYNANLNSVFISGGSAGGHLTCAVALAIASGNYTEFFGNNLTVKGLVPFYPGNGHAGKWGGSVELINPDDYLVNATSPPCLIFQGLEDGIVHPSIAQDLKDAYSNAGNSDCALLNFPLGGHAADLYFTGYYNQVFLYYMERFLYLCVNNLI